jgi:hypothetical protein
MGAVPAMMADDAEKTEKCYKSSRCQREIGQQSADCQQSDGPLATIVIPGAEAPSGPEVHHNGHNAVTTNTTGAVSLKPGAV